MIENGWLRGSMLVATLFAGVARAAPPHVELDWSDRAGCAGPADIDGEVARFLGDVTLDGQSPRFEVQVTSGAQGFHLALRGQVGAREVARAFDLASCAEVHETAILLVAMTLSPASFTNAPAEPTSGSLARRTAGQVAPPHWALWFAGVGDFLTLPGASAGPALGLRFAWDLLRIGVEGRYFIPRDQALGMAARADVSLTSFALSGGLRWTIGTWALGPDLATELGFLRAHAIGTTSSAPRRTLWSAALLGLATEWRPAARVSLELAAAAGLPFWRPRFALQDEPAFYTASPAIFRLSLGICVWLDTKD